VSFAGQDLQDVDREDATDQTMTASTCRNLKKFSMGCDLVTGAWLPPSRE
jgi:hypothetical protein